MNYRRSRVYSAPVPKMPPGLLELMEGLSNDVLRNNPTNIYEFCADHMEKLLQIRDNKPAKYVMTLEDKITKAQKIISERAKRRHEKYDKMIAEQQNECNLHQIIHDSAMNMQKNVVIAAENEISAKQVELLDTVESFDLKGSSNEINNKCNEDEYVRNLLIKNSSIKEQDTDDSKTDDYNLIQNQDHIKNVQVENNDNKENIEEIKVIPMQALKSQPALDINNKIIEDVIENLDHKESYEEPIVGKTLEVDVNETDDYTAPDKNHSIADVKSDELKQSLEITSHSDPSLKPSDSIMEQDIIITDTEHKEQASECRNGINRDKNRSVDSEMSSVKNRDEKLLINNDDNSHTMDLETAAITIQKVFRSFLFKCKTTSVDESTNVDINLFINDKDVKEDIKISNVNKERRGISRMDTVLQTVNEEKSLSLSTDDSSTLSSAATVIQAHIRGFLVRNKLHVNKTLSTSLVDSDAVSGTSLELDSDQQKGKTILNIHIVPERGHFVSRDESLFTSMDLSMDGCPRSLTSLHPHSYDINERRRQLKREDAVQSVSPPSNNSSSKLSEDVDSVRECLLSDVSSDVAKTKNTEKTIDKEIEKYVASGEIQTAVENEVCDTSPHTSVEKLNGNSDEMDVVTPDKVPNLNAALENNALMHSSEFHEVVLPTQVSRSDTSVVRGE